MRKTDYTNEEIAAYLEVAVEIGITRAMRSLGYPKSWATGKKWVEQAGIEVPLDSIKAQAAEHHDWYKTEELLLVAQEGITRVHLELQTADLSPDEHKKMSEAYQKYVNTWLLLQGKANNISETRKSDGTDIALMELINEETARNARLEEEGVNSQPNE